MGKWGINNGLCRVCGERTEVKNVTPKGKLHYRAYCTKHRRKHESSYRGKERHRYHVGYVCERCGFEAEHIAQMDVHHIDGDHFNNNAGNLVTLCACCHRLEHLDGRVNKPKRVKMQLEFDI